MSDFIISFYAVRNSEGEYLRSKGFNGYGKTWVPELTSAKIWPTLGGARSRVTFFANNFPGQPIPDIIELGVTTATVMEGERDRAAKAVKKIAERKVAEDIRHRKHQLEMAQTQLNRAKENLINLKKKK